MRLLDLVAEKRDGGEHDAQELGHIVRATADGTAPDYQLAAWLMAAFLNGLTERETVALTRAMAGSGRKLHLRSLGKRVVDKHSTGGVGDGISLALAPMVASMGVAVPMMSGRGLGHTGGTLDKLESIDGFKVRLDVPAIERQLRDIGVCLFGQSADLNPADRKLYALRDATATVESIPLIVASILSKKVTEDLDALVLDVKSGAGAFMRDAKDAALLGRRLVKTARGLGLRCVGLVTDMDQPLGRAVGNACEMRQAVEVLQGDGSCADYVELLLALGGWMVHLAGKARDWEAGARMMEESIRSGRAIETLRRIIQCQGGDPDVTLDPKKSFPDAPLSRGVAASVSGFVARLDARAVGEAAVLLGAGRGRMEDTIDFGAGIRLERKVGDAIKRGEVIARLFTSDKKRLAAAEAKMLTAISIGKKRAPRRRLIREVIR